MNHQLTTGVALTPSTASLSVSEMIPRKKPTGRIRRLPIARGADLGALRTLLVGNARIEVALAGGKRERLARRVDISVLQVLARRPDVVRLELVIPSS